MKHLLVIVSLVLFAGTLACGSDDDPVDPVKVTEPQFWNRTQKWHVLSNLEVGYNKRSIAPVRALLDEYFTFYLTDKDVQGGLPEAWGRETEVSITTHMFSSSPPGDMPRIKALKLDIQWENNLSWVDVAAPVGDETWYMATCYVDFKLDVEPDLTFISNPGTKAQFVVRNTGTESEPLWTLVEMRDLGAPSGPSAVAAARATEPATWGHVKALFI